MNFENTINIIHKPDQQPFLWATSLITKAEAAMPIKNYLRKLIKICSTLFAPVLPIKDLSLPWNARRLHNVALKSKLVQSLEHFHLEGRVLDTTANYRIDVKEETDQDRSA